MKKQHSIAGKIAFALGKGIIAGLAGTAAMTAAQVIDMKVTHRKPSNAPAVAAKKVFDIKAINKGKMERFSNEVHWSYGTSWGITRGVMDVIGLRHYAATLAHFAAIWGTAMIIEPTLNIAPPITEWEPKTIVKDGMYHLIYAVVAGIVYDAID